MDLNLPTPAGELTRAEQKILDYINTNTDAFLFSSIGQLAQRLELDLDPDGIPLFVSALGGIIEAWLLDLFPDTPEKMVSRINSFLQSHIYGLQVLQHHPEWICTAGNGFIGDADLPAQQGDDGDIKE